MCMDHKVPQWLWCLRVLYIELRCRHMLPKWVQGQVQFICICRNLKYIQAIICIRRNLKYIQA